MADRWMDDRDREWRERDWRRSEAYGQGEARGRPGETRRYEDRSWEGPQDDPGGAYPARRRRPAHGYEDEDYHGRSGLTAGGPAYGYLPRQGADYGRAEDYSYARSYRADRDREERRGGDRGFDRELERRYADDRPYGGDYAEEGRGHRGVGPRGYQRSDERISDEAHDRLTDDPWLDASNIELVVRAGEITLSGHVENRQAKHRAEYLVEELSGVRHVQNNLRVDPNAGFTGAGRGYGSGAVEAEMRRNEAAPGGQDHPPSGLWGRTSTGARAEQSDPGVKRN